ncbi:MAG: hypothetical protein H6577_04555 [Lewinellaceae bacterium]|nr:hypothetical protein [Saprospiraceae bacterium]MCB9337373.1 hypothetical protein [Lewinellaceae bacterium]
MPYRENNNQFMEPENSSPQSVADLAQWMKDHCFNFNHYSIGGNAIHEGYGIEKWGGLYIWYYSEKGRRDNLQYFQSEKDITEYAFGKITADIWARAHCIGLTKNAVKAGELAGILQSMGVEYKQDTIPEAGSEKPLILTYIFGCDVRKTETLKAIYFENILPVGHRI